MHLYLIRHAHAEDGKNDAARPLSDKGRRQIRSIGRWLRDAEAVDVSEIWHSPLLRSRDTAHLLAKHLRLASPLREVSGLKPDDDPSSVARKISDARSPLAIVGHEPHLSALASLLVVGKSEPPRFKLKKCTVLRLERSGTGWSVRWQISPELI